MFPAQDLAALAPMSHGQRARAQDPGRDAAARLQAVTEPCTLRSANGRVRDGMVRHAGTACAVVGGVSGLGLGQEVVLVLVRRGGLRLRGHVAGLGVMGLLIDLHPADRGADWRRALLAMTEPQWSMG